MYATELTYGLSERTLIAVRVESARYSSETGKPLWAYTFHRTAGSEQKVGDPISCVQFAD